MRLRNTIIVLILLAVVGGYSLIILLGSRPVPPPTLLKLDSKHISGIDLRYPDSELELVRNPNHTWSILKPIKTDGDQGSVDGLTETIANAQLTRTIEEKPDSLKPFGLDKPAVTLTVTTDDKGVLPALLVGRVSPVSSGVYVKLADQPAVLMTTSDFPSAISKKVNDLRSHELMTFNMDDAEQIVLRSGANQPIEIDRQGGQWRIVAPGHYTADSDTIAQILTTLVDARIDDFVTDAPTDLGQYGLKNPQIEVTVYQRQGQDRARAAHRAGAAAGLEEGGLRQTRRRAFGLHRRRCAAGQGQPGAVRFARQDRDGLRPAEDRAAGDRKPRQAVHALARRGRQVAGDGRRQELARQRTGGADLPRRTGESQGRQDRPGSDDRSAEVRAWTSRPSRSWSSARTTNRSARSSSPRSRTRSRCRRRLRRMSDTAESKPKAERTEMRIENYATSSAGTAVYSLRESDFSQFDMSARSVPDDPAARDAGAAEEIARIARAGGDRRAFSPRRSHAPSRSPPYA